MPSPTTVIDLIKTAMRYGGVIATGETPSAAETADGLQSFNDVIERFSLDSMAVLASASDTFTTIPGVALYTMGPGGTFGTDRPLRIDDMQATFGGVDFTVQPITQAEYNAIGLKTIRTPVAERFAFVPAFPAALVYLFPTPSVAYPIKISSQGPLTKAATAATVVDLPPGYARAIALAMWADLAPQYGQQPTASVLRMAQDAYAAIKRANRVPQVATFDPALLGNDDFLMWRVG